MFPEEWEGVAEEEVRSFFKWNSSQGVEPTFVSLLEFFGEGFVSSEGSVSHFADDTQWR